MDILYEDNHLIAVNKPFTMPSQGDESKDQSVFDWVKEYIKVTYQKPGNVYAGLLHRLDRPTGGVLLLAKTSKAASRVSKQFQERQVKKTYLAISEKPPLAEEGQLEHYMRKIGGKNIMKTFNKEVAHSKKAILSYRSLQVVNNCALIEIYPHTGRRHQIRAQLASIGCTIKGDVKYGKTNFNPDKSICLFASQLSLTHPTLKKELLIQAPYPKGLYWDDFHSPIVSG